ncbi:MULTISPECIES: hypothetical protein [Clostridium]|uniref:hypothetical protein n=1 Tax=Clostridium TaxID=1485 RepID=UPI00155A8468|nr:MULTISPECIES: hypothetical protein [Clostridium]MDB1932986.1 hypothetical protein [Clostridium tertium]MDB1938346.1 hypothetical protein [Clostridium tertium]MDU6363045.1 hypothetical protein [Clostridium sp.]
MLHSANININFETGYSSKVKSVKYNEEEVTCIIELEDKVSEILNEKNYYF